MIIKDKTKDFINKHIKEKSKEKTIRESIKFIGNFMQADEYNYHLINYFKDCFGTFKINEIEKEIEKNHPDISQEFRGFLRADSLKCFNEAMFVFDQYLNKDKDLQ